MREIAIRHFGKTTINALDKLGIQIIDMMTIPGDGEMPMANGTTGYCVNDNGVGRVLTWQQVKDLAASGH